MDIVSPHTQNNSTTFIYCLRDPETQLIRYVGKANDPQIRLVRHLREYTIGESQVGRVVKGESWK